jgi:DNA polymerase-3 subunit alpha
MSKKKQHVMEVERENFVQGNADENVPGCASKNIAPEVANAIYDSMMDFAKYAFNKSHAACYAVVALQTAWLKYYYPVEFMAALMTSVIDNPGKVSGYIMSCRNMNITLLPPDINEGFDGFSVTEIDAEDDKLPTPGAAMTCAPGRKKAIRYALTAIKGIGRPVIASIVKEREYHGKFKNINDFLTRMQGRENDVNKRAVENFIKAGAFDCFDGTRKQLMTVYGQIMDQLHTSGKNAMAGQMSLFDLATEDVKKQYEIPLPDVGEFPRELLLEFEKEVLGIYVSGHPLEEYAAMWKRKITNTTADFVLDDDTGVPEVKDNANATIGGIISSKKIKYTKNDQVMAFLTLEDMVGSVEVIVFPKTYEANAPRLNEDSKIFIEGRVSVEDERDAKLIASKITLFDEVPKAVWLGFANKAEYDAKAEAVNKIIADSDGNDEVVICLTETRQMKNLGRAFTIKADKQIIEAFENLCGKENVKIR